MLFAGGGMLYPGFYGRTYPLLLLLKEQLELQLRLAERYHLSRRGGERGGTSILYHGPTTTMVDMQ